MSVDPYMRGRMNEGKSYVPPFQIGQPLEGGAVGRVVASLDEKLPIGTFVQSIYGWRDAFVSPAAKLQIVDTSLAPPSAYLGVLGVTGLTAWVGSVPHRRLKGWRDGLRLRWRGRSGKRCLPTGKTARLPRSGQCRALKKRCPSSATNSRSIMPSTTLTASLLTISRRVHRMELMSILTTQAAPNWRLRSMPAPFGRIAMCGGIAGYNTPVPGPRNLMMTIGKRLRLEGFIVSDHFKDLPAFQAEAVPALKSGKLVSHETFVEGLNAAPSALIDLLHSGAGNIGKMIVKLDGE